MKFKIFTSILILSISTACFAQQNYLDSLLSGGMMRTYRVYVPAVYDGQSPRPLLFNFHGLGDDAVLHENFSKFRSVADTANFILITPNGTVNPEFNPNFGQSWSNFDCCPTTDDVSFVSDMIDSLSIEFNIDPNRIYSAGYSNGGFMGYDLACKLSDRIAAIASVAGSIEVSRLTSCNPNRPVPVLEIHGTNDGIIPYDGGSFIGVTFHSVDSVFGYWRVNNQCSEMSEFSMMPDTNPSDGSTVERYIYPYCAEDSSVELLKVLGGGHDWPGSNQGGANQDIIVENEIWRFFLKHQINTVNNVQNISDYSKINVYPNPVDDYLDVKLPQLNMPYDLQVSDMTGRSIRINANVNDEGFRLNTSALSPGIYIIQVRHNGNIATGKFLKID